MTDPTTALTVNDRAPDQVKRLGEIMNAKMSALIDVAPAALAKYMDPMRIAKMALHAYQTNKDLMECSPQSYFVALYDALKYGLDPTSPHGYAYLVPRKKKACFQVGYKGYLHLARKLGMVRDARANVVVAGEPFEADYIAGTIAHKWSPEVDHTDEEKYVAAYCIAWPTDGDRAFFTVLDRQQVHARRAVAMTQNIWKAWPDRMWRKTAVLTLFRGGEIEINPLFAELMERDTEFEVGETKTVVATSGVGAVKAALGIAVEPDPVDATLPTPEPAEMPADDDDFFSQARREDGGEV